MFEVVSLSGTPDKITTLRTDCLWVYLKPDIREACFKSPALQWLDWKLRGEVARFVLKEERPEVPTFVPSAGRIASPLVALEFLPSKGQALKKNVETMKFSSVGCFFESQSQPPTWLTALSLPHTVHFQDE